MSLRSFGLGDFRQRRLSLRQPFERRHALGHMVIGLLVDGVDRDLGAAEQAGIVERADLQNHGGQTRRPCDDMGAAFGAEFPCHRALQVAAFELLGSFLVYLKPAIGISTNRLVEPPEMYWHSRQWHCAFIIGSPSAS